MENANNTTLNKNFAESKEKIVKNYLDKYTEATRKTIDVNRECGIQNITINIVFPIENDRIFVAESIKNLLDKDGLIVEIGYGEMEHNRYTFLNIRW